MLLEEHVSGAFLTPWWRNRPRVGEDFVFGLRPREFLSIKMIMIRFSNTKTKFAVYLEANVMQIILKMQRHIMTVAVVIGQYV